MKILILSKKTKFLKDKRIFGTENIIKVICNEMNKLGIDIQTFEPNKNQNYPSLIELNYKIHSSIF